MITRSLSCFTIVLLLAKGNCISQSFTHYVNPFIGTQGTGHTFPGVTTPLGFVQLSPETNNLGWAYCAGYQYQDKSIIGFAHTHLSGTGVMDLGDVLMLPYTGNVKRDSFRVKIEKTSEKASPGYYTVTLPDDGIKVELTATQRTGVQRYTFIKGENAHILLDLQSGLLWEPKNVSDHVVDSKINIESNTLISGSVHTKWWVDQQIYFVILFSKPFIQSQFLDGDVKRKLVVDYAAQAGESLEVRVGISTVSIEGAKLNLEESKNKSFEEVKSGAEKLWNSYLSKIKIEGTEEQKVNFYTSMYHLFIQPNNITDIDGKYRGADDKVYQSPSKSYYSTLSIWDTYRATHPLYTILTPEKDAVMVSSMLDHFDVTGLLPIWTLWGKENFCMIGNHAVPIITDAFFKGLLKKEDSERAYRAIKQSLTINSWPKYNWSIYDKYGYFPSDTVKTEAVSRTLEATTDDWCAAQFAKALGKTDDYNFFIKRAGYYKNLYDPSTKFMRGRMMNGNWNIPFDPIEASPGGGAVGDFTEGNSWQYSWHVQHDIPGLIDLIGGKQAFKLKLDSLFTIESKTYSKEGSVEDITGLIGQYAHGNEPSHHVIYLYNYVDAPFKTQELIPQVLKTFYNARPDGLIGNDDCGQMSAWYVFSALGFYPVNPATGIFDIGVPSFKQASIKVGKMNFTIKAISLSEKNRYIQSIKLNGKLLNTYQISYRDIMQGGVLEFFMGPNIKPVQK